MRLAIGILVVILAQASGAGVNRYISELKPYGTFTMELLADGEHVLQFEDRDSLRRWCYVTSNWICRSEVIIGRPGVIPQKKIDAEMLAQYPEWHIQTVAGGTVKWQGGVWFGYDQAFVATNNQIICLIKNDADGPRAIVFHGATWAPYFTGKYERPLRP